MPELRITIPGQPQPQGSKNGYLRGGRIVLVESAKGLKGWRKQVAFEAARAATGWRIPDKDTPIRLSVTFFLTKPKSIKRIFPTVKPDLDKLLRGLCDGISDSRCVWVDDNQVTLIVASKVYAGAAPMTYVEVNHD